MEEMKEIETTAEVTNENVEVAEPVESHEGVCPMDDGFGAGDVAIVGFTIAGVVWTAKSLWKYVLKPGYKWVKTRVDEEKAKKTEKKSDAESNEDSKKH